jgi:hypothetical protein
MADKSSSKEIGVAVDNNPSNLLRPDEFIPQLRGQRGIRRLREMRENDATVGAILFTIEQMLRPIPWQFRPADDSRDARRAADIMTRSMEQMDTTWEEFISDALSFFTYGFSTFEKIYQRDRKSGDILLQRLSPRPQWSIERFEAKPNGDLVAAVQSTYFKRAYIPSDKLLHFRSMPENQSPSGRSVLRNAYVPYYRLSYLQEIEVVAIERELNGLPLGRIPGSFLSDNATPDQVNILNYMEKALRDLKNNEQGYLILPSDLITDENGNPTQKYIADISLVSSNGTRDIDITKSIVRYQQDIARSVMADFVMLGANDRGSFAMSQSKSDMFLKALHGYMNNISSTLQRQLLPQLCAMNGIPKEKAPVPTYGQIASVDITELGTYLQKLSMAGAPLFPDDQLEDHLRREANLPEKTPEDEPLGSPEE